MLASSFANLLALFCLDNTRIPSYILTMFRFGDFCAENIPSYCGQCGQKRVVVLCATLFLYICPYICL
ncbi:hypothetical protein FTO65_21175 [Bacillus cereus]|nr:hypothetical protein [Bacillus cereus]